ncbi:MAG: AhpC/TSA family protein [Chitinophagaceae bacterium]|nr:AhpC/TSA family protein [Chitinophagaceae bacterium]
MKRALLFIFILCVATHLFSQKNSNSNFNFKGKVIGQDSGFIHLAYFDSLKNYINDSCSLNHGRFQFKGIIKGATVATFYGNRKSRSVDDPNWTEIFLEPGNIKATFKVNEFKNAKIIGSKSQNDFENFNNRVGSVNAKWKNTFDELDEAKSKNDIGKIQKIYDEQLPQYRNQRSRVALNFIKEFPNSDISAYLLFNEINLSLDSLKTYYSLLATSVQQSFYGSNIDSSIVRQEKLQIGMPAPDFNQIDLNGNQISLKKFRGKYILLDFWASWCLPCREEHPYLKKAYAKYHDKGFEIIGFSLDGPENKTAWREAVKKDDLQWVQLCDFKVWNSDLIIEYNYLGGKGIPANFLINPEGKIIAKDLRGDDVEKELSGLIK